MSRPNVDPKAKPVVDPKAKARARDRCAPGRHSDRRAAARREPPADAANTTVLDTNGADTKLGAAAATISHETSGIPGGATQGAKSVAEIRGRRVEAPDPTGSNGGCG